MDSITPLSLILLGALTAAILYPDQPANRAARTRRVLAATATYVVTLHIFSVLITTPPALWPEFLVDWRRLLTLAVLAPLPFSVAERLAELARPHRSFGWAAVGIGWGFIWSGIVFVVVIWAVGASPRWDGFALIYTLPSIVTGLVWYVMLPRRQPPIREVFQ